MQHWGVRRRHLTCRTAQVVCQSHVVLRWVVACLQRWWWGNSACQSSSSATSVVVSSLMPRCQYTSHSVSRNGKFRTASCQGQRDDLLQRNQKSSYKQLTWRGWCIYSMCRYVSFCCSHEMHFNVCIGSVPYPYVQLFGTHLGTLDLRTNF